MKTLALLLLIILPPCSLLAQETDQDWYGQKFEEADSLVLAGLPRDAALVYDQIFQQARMDNNQIILIKVINERMINRSYFEIDALNGVIDMLQEDMKSLDFPVNQIAHSILGDLYWNYYQQNRWQIHSRTTLESHAGDDITTWDLKRIMLEVIREYDLSLQNATKLKEIQVEQFEGVLRGNENFRNLRPTLYDLLAHRVLQTYQNSETGLIAPVESFVINKTEYFSLGNEFVAIPVESADTLSLIYRSVKLYQGLIQFHLSNNNENAYCDLELNRLNFIHNQSTLPIKGTLYEKALSELSGLVKENHNKSEVLYRLAEYIFDSQESMRLPEVHKVLEDIIVKFPDTQGSYHAAQMKTKIEEPFLSIQTERVIQPQKPFLVNLTYKNITTAYFRLYKVNSDLFMDYNFNGRIPVDTFLQMSSFHSWEQSLPPFHDYASHSAEVPLISLEKGFYVIAVSNRQDFGANVELAAINVSGLYILKRDIANKTEYLVYNSLSGKIQKKAELKLIKQDYDYTTRKYYKKIVEELTTNLEGKAFPGVDASYEIWVTYNGDSLYVPNDYNYHYKNYPHQDYRTILFTDRAIYRPGQTVHFKGLMLECIENNCEILPEEEDEVYFNDANGEELDYLDVETNEFGTFSGSFVIPQGLLNGMFELECSDGSAWIRVEEYKRPTFEVTLLPIEKTYNYNDTVSISGHAKAYAGYPIDNAKISYRIMRQKESRWYWYRFQEQPKQVAIGTDITNDQGDFEFHFVADDSDIQEKDQIYAYTITIEVTDVNGETRSATNTLRISNSPLLIETNIPDVLVLGDIKDLELKAMNLNHQHVPAKATVNMIQLQPPSFLVFDRPWEEPDAFVVDEKTFRQRFPNRVYKNETDPHQWMEKENVFSRELELSGKLSKEPFETLSAGYYKVNIIATGEGNSTAEWTRVIRVIHKKPTRPTRVKDWVTAIKTSGEPGEHAIFHVSALKAATPVKYEVFLDKKVIKSTWIKPGTRAMEIKIPLEEKHRGGFAVQFVQLAEGQSFVSFHEIDVPFSNKMLDVSFTTFRNRLLPGEQDQWKLSIRNLKGEKEMSEMVATLYDASLDIFAPLRWTTSFTAGRNHELFQWNTRLIPQMAHKRMYKRQFIHLGQWSKNYEELNLSFSYYGGYNHYYYNLSRKIQERFLEQQRRKQAEELEKEKEEARRKKEEQEKFRQITLNKMISENDSLLSLLKSGKIEKLDSLVGNVIDVETLEPLPGASITILGTTKGTISDFEGRFILKNIPKHIWLHIRFVGFGDEYVRVEADSIKIVLTPDVQALEEIVVVGYGVEKKQSITGAISSIEFEDMETNIADSEKTPSPDFSQIQARTNFNETAFFYPHLITDENGDITIDFTITEALTRWKMMGFAHTKDFKTGFVQNELVTQKEVSVMVNAPRFFREGDTIKFVAKVNNLTEQEIAGEALIQLFDAINNQPIDSLLLQSDSQIDFSVGKGLSTGLSWELIIPEGIQAVTYKVLARSGPHTDGEESTVPVLINKQMLTESLPFMVRAHQTRDYQLDKMLHNKSETLRNEAYTVEFTANPAWYAVQAMPYLIEFPYECSEQVFSRFYANSLSATIVNSSPRIKEVFTKWKNTGAEALISNLEKNQELKSLLIQETPWVMNGKNETEQRQRIGLLFDSVALAENLQTALQKLQNTMTPGGGFGWFNGMPANRFITQHIVAGFGQLKHLQAIQPQHYDQVNDLLQDAIKYLDACFVKDYQLLIKLSKEGNVDLEKDHLSVMHIHYLYMKSFFSSVEPTNELQEATNFYLAQAKKYWLLKGEYAQGMLALVFERMDDKDQAQMIVKSLSNRASRSDELGMYWPNNKVGYWWYQSPIETQALLIEAFAEITGDMESVEEMKIWLLRNKQATDWKTTKATSAACYALLLRGKDLLINDHQPEVRVGGELLQNMKSYTPETGTGYVKTTFYQDEIRPELSQLHINNPNDGVMWGAVYWQYFEQLDKITTSETNLKINKQLFVKEHSASGPVLKRITTDQPVRVGSEVVVRIEIRADRDFEYVHLKDMRASGFEPVSALSGYRYQDGLGYYQSIKDASINFFVDYLRKGTYVFEYSLRAVHTGLFSNGITTMQSMYAPEFTTHSEGIRVEIVE